MVAHGNMVSLLPYDCHLVYRLFIQSYFQSVLLIGFLALPFLGTNPLRKNNIGGNALI